MTASPAEITAIDIVLEDGLVWRSYELAVHTDTATAVVRLPSADGTEKEDLARQARAAVSGTGGPRTARHTVTSYRVLVSAHGNSLSLTRGAAFTESSAQNTAQLLTSWLAEEPG